MDRPRRKKKYLYPAKTGKVALRRVNITGERLAIARALLNENRELEQVFDLFKSHQRVSRNEIDRIFPNALVLLYNNLIICCPGGRAKGYQLTNLGKILRQDHLNKL